MAFGRVSLSLAATVTVLAVTLSVALIWLLATDPGRAAAVVADAQKGDVAPALRALGSVVYGALRGLLKYL